MLLNVPNQSTIEALWILSLKGYNPIVLIQYKAGEKSHFAK